MKRVQSIYQVMQLEVPLNRRVDIGRTTLVFTDHQLHLLKITGKPLRLTDEGVFLNPDLGVVPLHPGIHLVIETGSKDSSDTAIDAAREANEECAAVASLLFGKRATEVHVGENVIEGAELIMTGNAMRTPHFQKRRNITQEQFEKLEKIFDGPPREDGSQIELALRWYMKGRREPYGPDAYLSFWVAIEVLFGEWKNMDHKLSIRLAEIIPGEHPPAIVRDRLKLGRLISLRADIVHKGKQQFSLPEESFQLVIIREILEELLKARIGIPGRDRFSQLVASPDEWDRRVTGEGARELES